MLASQSSKVIVNSAWSKREFKQAVPVLRPALELDAENVVVQQKLGWALTEQYAEAVPVLHQAVSLDPDRSCVLENSLSAETSSTRRC